MKIHKYISIILLFTHSVSAMERRQSTREVPHREISAIDVPRFIGLGPQQPLIAQHEKKKEDIVPEGLILKLTHLDDFVAPLDTPRIFIPIPRFPSNDETLKSVNKRKWNFNFVKKQDPEFARRKALYREHFFNEFSSFDTMELPQKKALWREKFNGVGVNKNEIYSNFREDAYFHEEYKHLRNLAKTKLKKHFKKILHHNLNFLEQQLLWDKIYTSNSIKNSDNQIELEKTIYKISSMPMYMSIQRDYLSFLEEFIMPIAQNAPEEISWFYREMAHSALQCKDIPEGQAQTLATTNFILRIIGPILYDARSILIKYEGWELQEMEEKELLFQNIPLPQPGTKEETMFVTHMCERMNIEKIDKINETYEKYGRNSAKRKRKERDLTKLIQKSFKSDSEFLETDFHDFLGGFYLLISDELKFLHDPSFGKTDKEIKNIIKLRERFAQFKKDLQMALF